MQRGIRIGVGIVGAFFTLQAIGWIADPARAAAGLGMPLLEGLARSTQVGDLTAFFLGLGVMTLLGAYTQQRQWLQGAALLLGAAAVMRTLAWALHDAAFATQFITIEIVCCAGLLFAATQMRGEAA